MLQLVYHLVSHCGDEHALGYNQRVYVNVGHLLIRHVVAVGRRIDCFTMVYCELNSPKLASK